MKPIIVLCINAVLALYFAMYLLSNRLWPDENLLRAVNVVFALLVIWPSYDVVTIYLTKTHETSLIYKVYSALTFTAHGFFDYIQPFRRQFVIGCLIAIGVIVISFLSLGIAGALLMELPVMLGLAKPITGDNAWPAALIISITWPFFIPLGVVVKHELSKLGYASLATAALLCTVVIGMMACTGLAYLLFPPTQLETTTRTQ
jgi:hypothetical protein